MDILTGIRPLDYVVTAALGGLAVALAVGNVNLGPHAHLAHATDSHSTLMIPVFLLAALPTLWRRRAVLPAVAASTAVLAASLPAFGWVTRCGFALPLSFVLAYSVARFAGSRQHQLLGLVGVLALQTVALVMDSSTGGLGALPLSVPIAAACYGAGLFVQSRVQKQADAPTLIPEHVHA